VLINECLKSTLNSKSNNNLPLLFTITMIQITSNAIAISGQEDGDYKNHYISSFKSNKSLRQVRYLQSQTTLDIAYTWGLIL